MILSTSSPVQCSDLYSVQFAAHHLSHRVGEVKVEGALFIKQTEVFIASLRQRGNFDYRRNMFSQFENSPASPIFLR